MAFVDFAELKASLRIEDSLQKLGLTLKRRGEALRGPCPTCRSGGDRALVVTPGKQAFYCFGARTGGDVIALAAHIQGIGMKDAAAFLAGKGSERAKRQQDTVPEERAKEAARSLQPLSYLEPEHHLV
jgi:DNA primase